MPLDDDGTGVKAFMLVPCVGACIHAPPAGSEPARNRYHRAAS
nr:DUF3299 domain-containing protein [Primorskyibacter marinus]